MATSGTITGSYGSGTSGLKLRASWSRTSSGIDATGPYSVITVTIEYTRTSTGYTTYKLNAPYSLELDGTVVDSGNHTYDVRSVSTNTYVTYISKTNITLRHDSNGAKTATLKFTVNLSGTSAKNGTISGNIALDSIPMGSTIKLNASSYTISSDTGPTATVTITRYNTAYYHKIVWKVGSTTVYSKNVGQVASTTQALAAADWATKFTTSKSATATATLYTYSDSGYTKQVGTASEASFEIVCSKLPTVSQADCSISPSSVSYTKGITNVYISGYTKALLTIEARAYYNASITKINFYENDALAASVDASALSDGYYIASWTSSVLNSGDKTLKYEAVDSRGNATTRYSASYVLQPYSVPGLTVSAFRTANSTSTAKSDSGTYLRITATATTSSSQNSLASLNVKSKLTSASSYGSATTLTSGTAKNISGFAAANSYDILVTATDKIGNSTTYHVVIPTESVTLDFPVGGKGLGIGTVATEGSNRIDTPWSLRLNKSGVSILQNTDAGGSFVINDTSTDGKSIALMVGTGHQNRGLYDNSQGDWSYYIDGSNNVFINRLRNINSAPLGSGASERTLFLSDPPKSVVDADATAYSDDYWKSYLKWVCATYPDLTNTLFIGRLSPSSRCIVILFIYSTVADYVDDTTGLPQYSFGIYIPYQGTTARDAFYKFGTSAYTFYRYNPFGSVPTRSSTTTQSDIFSGLTLASGVTVSSCARYVYGGVAQIDINFSVSTALADNTQFAAAIFKDLGTSAYEPISRVGGAGQNWAMWGTNSNIYFRTTRAVSAGTTIRTSFTYITHG